MVSAIGAFVDPKPCELPGLDDFAGKVIHSASWDHDDDLGGKRVAIGTGATAVQLIPQIARDVAQLDVYQRTPIWVAPKIDTAISPAWRKLFARFPFTQRLLRYLATSSSSS